MNNSSDARIRNQPVDNSWSHLRFVESYDKMGVLTRQDSRQFTDVCCPCQHSSEQVGSAPEVCYFKFSRAHTKLPRVERTVIHNNKRLSGLAIVEVC